MIRWTPNVKVERYPDHAEPPSWGELADALDECVAALRAIYIADSFYHATLTARDTLRKLGVEP